MNGIISKDKKNPTRAYVWESNKNRKVERIIVDILSDGSCMAVDGGCADNYVNGKAYSTYVYSKYEIIKPKQYRAYKNGSEFRPDFIKRPDCRIVNKHTQSISTIIDLYMSRDFVGVGDGVDLKYDNLFDNYTWLDGSIIGVEE